MPPTPDDNRSLSGILEDEGNDGDFVFSDHVHGQQEFEALQRSMSAFLGTLDDLEHRKGSLPFSSSRKKISEDALISTVDTKNKTTQDAAYVTKAIHNESFHQGQQDALVEVLVEIDNIEAAYRAKGMREWNFTWGLLHCLGIAYVFGALPGYFWILYVGESVYWISSKFLAMWKTKPMCEIYYYFDFCWVMNLSGVLVFVVGFVGMGDLISSDIRRQLFLGTFGIAAGPVFMASMALPFVAFLFHDVNTMANLIIHTTPSMLLYVLRWQPETMQDAFPSLFDLNYITAASSNGQSLIPFSTPTGVEDDASIARNATWIYMTWFIPYTLWMLIAGLKMPGQKQGGDQTIWYDTVFHSLWRDGPCELVGKLVWKRSAETSQGQSKHNDFEVRDFLLYAIGHALACVIFGIHGLARLCQSSQAVHGLCLCISTLICARRGGQRYTYYSTAMYGQKLRKYVKARTLQLATNEKEVEKEKAK